jgi:hypothetical protein
LSAACAAFGTNRASASAGSRNRRQDLITGNLNTGSGGKSRLN